MHFVITWTGYQLQCLARKLPFTVMETRQLVNETLGKKGAERLRKKENKTCGKKEGKTMGKEKRKTLGSKKGETLEMEEGK